MAIPLNMGGSCSVCVPLYITKRSEAVLQWGKRKNIKKMMINHFFRHDRKRNCKSASRVCDRCRFFRTIKQQNFKQYHFRDCVLADRSYCYGNFIHHDGITDSLDWLSGGENLPEILLGYHQYHDGDNEYSYCNLLRKMDKINHSDEPYSTVTSCARGLYRNPMLCERLAGGTRILLKQKENRKIL